MSPVKTRRDAVEFCASEYGGTLANVTSYDTLRDVNEAITARFDRSVGRLTGSREIWSNGKTNQHRGLINLDAGTNASVTDTGKQTGLDKSLHHYMLVQCTNCIVEWGNLGHKFQIDLVKKLLYETE